MAEKTIIVKKAGFGTFLRGAIIGAGIALLLAPRSGRETRDMLSVKGTELRDKASEIARDTRSRAETVLHDARNKLDDKVKSVKEGVSPTSSEAVKDLKRELEITEEINNPLYPL